MAVDAFGNVFFADSGNNAIKEWVASSTQVISMAISGLNSPHGVAVDGQQNVYIADTANNAIKRWSVANPQVTTYPISGLKAPTGVAVDFEGNIYIADTSNNYIREFSSGFFAFNSSGAAEPAPAGTGSVPITVLPTTLPLTATSSAAWLTITGMSNGTISYSFTANTSASSRSAEITVLGQSLTVTQSSDSCASIAIVAGNNQSVAEGRAYTALQIKAEDANTNAITGASVTFTVTPGSNGAGGTFASSSPVVTNSSGNATASKLTANTIPGSFTVTAACGTASTQFHLTIVK